MRHLRRPPIIRGKQPRSNSLERPGATCHDRCPNVYHNRLFMCDVLFMFIYNQASTTLQQTKDEFFPVTTSFGYTTYFGSYR